MAAGGHRQEDGDAEDGAGWTVPRDVMHGGLPPDGVRGAQSPRCKSDTPGCARTMPIWVPGAVRLGEWRPGWRSAAGVA
jgi:hypothetical protein